MRRTVKAWAVRLNRSDLKDPLVAPFDAGCRYDIFHHRGHAEKAVAAYVIPYTIIRCTVTYDDGRPSRSGAKRTKGGRRG